jgi:hypothetical protein
MLHGVVVANAALFKPLSLCHNRFLIGLKQTQDRLQGAGGGERLA